MTGDLSVLMVTAVSIGFLHTLLGPDHYLPFIVMAKSGRWSMTKTAAITTLCGVGHVMSSVVLGMVGVALGIAVSRLEAIESTRGNLAAWALIAFGIAYLSWGIRQALRNRPHTHPHMHETPDTDTHSHVHTHAGVGEHIHLHGVRHGAPYTPWVLFIIFVLGPCEPLIPLLMYPAAQDSFSGLILVTVAFGSVTILTMLGIVLAAVMGISFLPMKALERYAHAAAGAAILLSGMAIVFMGL